MVVAVVGYCQAVIILVVVTVFVKCMLCRRGSDIVKVVVVVMMVGYWR